jgi:hypothetical protein
MKSDFDLKNWPDTVERISNTPAGPQVARWTPS